MVKVTFVAFDGAEQSVDADVGMTLMEAAVHNGVTGIEAVCGGNCYCGTCRLHVAEGWMEKLVPATEEELGMIEAAEDDDPSARLGCQVPITQAMDGIVVRTPEFQK